MDEALAFTVRANKLRKRDNCPDFQARVIAWNDSKRRTVGDVLNGLTKAIKLAEKEEAA